jgi:metal-responsive CopG/Arc/MetJ family transcriptional regulator
MNVTVNISFQDTLLKEIDAEARRESRSRSELLREASRLYIQRQTRWKNVFAFGDAVCEKSGLSESDVESQIFAERNKK